MFATAVGFAALAVSEIRPVREMGLWTACGLIVAWLSCFTLFPALQSLLRTPMRSGSVPAGKWFPASWTRWFRQRAATAGPGGAGAHRADAVRGGRIVRHPRQGSRR
jgi:predicted exporter